MMVGRVQLTDAELFFYTNARAGYDPARETASSGKARTAIVLAWAEGAANERGWDLRWEPDTAHGSWRIVLVDRNRKPVARRVGVNLGLDSMGHPVQPDGDQVRLLAAELALQALANGWS